jgi:hypothetical protein
MPETLTFSGMTWDILDEKYGIGVGEGVLFAGCAPLEPTPTLIEMVRRARRFRLVNERAKAHRLVDPVLAEIETVFEGKITTVPEMLLEVKGVEGLSGTPDFVLSAGTPQRVVPLIAVVEAKKDDIDAGLPQCAAELYAAHLLDKGVPKRLYGCVTNGFEWRFLSFDGSEKRVSLDRNVYLVNELSQLLGVFRHVVEVSLAAIEAR